MMKQVVGGVFCGFFVDYLEEEIVDVILWESCNFVDEGISVLEKVIFFSYVIKCLMDRIQMYLVFWVEVYVVSIVKRFVSFKVDFYWIFYFNNCQIFCDNLIDCNLFGLLFVFEQFVDYVIECFLFR